MVQNNSINNSSSNLNVVNLLRVGSNSPVDSTAQITNEFSGNGSNVFASTRNTSNTANSHSFFSVAVGGSSAGDASTKYNIAATTDWATGIDNSDSDAYVIAASSALGTTNTQRISTTGIVNFPLTPAFEAKLSATDSNVTGQNENFQIGSGNAFTIIFDQNSNFNTNGTFTAPVTGRYHLNFLIEIGDIVAATTSYQTLVTSNRIYYGPVASPVAVKDLNAQYSVCYSVLADMDAGDTAVIKVQTNGEASTRIDVLAGAGNDFLTCFSGNLEC